MLFRTVYGPELPSVHAFVVEHGAVTGNSLRYWFVQSRNVGAEGANLDDAVAFLLAGGLLQRDTERTDTYLALPVTDFRLGLLQRLTALCRLQKEQEHPLDSWYIGILEHCFVRPNHTYVAKLHAAINALELPVPCSEEKANAWRRVMEYLDCGRRVRSGFFACYGTDLVLSMIRGWRSEGPLEEFLDHAETYVPVRTATGDLADAMAFSLLHLERSRRICLLSRGDYAGRAYLGDRRAKWLRVEV